MKKVKLKPSEAIKKKVDDFFYLRDVGNYDRSEIRWQKLMEWLDEELG